MHHYTVTLQAANGRTLVVPGFGKSMEMAAVDAIRYANRTEGFLGWLAVCVL